MDRTLTDMIATTFLVLFATSLLLNLLGIQLPNETLQLFSKPIIIPALIGYFIVSSKGAVRNEGKWIVIALIFSWIGDVLLMFQDSDSIYFLLGLSSFLLAHIFYITFFHTVKKRENIQSRGWLLIPVAVYYATLITILYPHLGDMKVPVPVYGIVISLMLLLALHMLYLKNKVAGKLMMLGALLFIISDSVLAINKFFQSFEGAGIIIMINYGLAQLLITAGAIRYLKQS